MRTKLVKRHWCDHCNKAGLQAHTMARHEKHCTLNPERACRVCGLLNGGSHRIPMEELLDLLPDPSAFLAAQWMSCDCLWRNGEYAHGEDCPNEAVRLTRALTEAMPKLREAVQDCPACILAALRQKKIPVPFVEGFDFKAEMQTVLRHAAERDSDFY